MLILMQSVDFSERRSEEVMFLLTLNVYCSRGMHNGVFLRRKANDIFALSMCLLLLNMALKY